MASSSSKERSLYFKKRYQNMDYARKEKRKEMMREYNRKRIYEFTSNMATKELYTCSNTLEENGPSHSEVGTASISQIHKRKKTTVLDIEMQEHINSDHLHEHILQGKYFLLL